MDEQMTATVNEDRQHRSGMAWPWGVASQLVVIIAALVLLRLL
jgi:hypothetical protein